MSFAIVQTGETILLVGGAPLQVGVLDEVIVQAPVLVAADSGAAQCLAAGHNPQAVIGDMDSLDPRLAARLAPGVVHRVEEQDSTDFDKALRHLVSPLVIGVGFTGGRIDHELAAYHTLLHRADRLCVLVGETEVVFLCPPTVSLPTEAGDIVSLFPLRACSGRSQGLEWPIEGLALSPGEKIGTSNRATGPVHLETDQPGLLVILPRSRLAPLAQSLTVLPDHARWSVRA